MKYKMIVKEDQGVTLIELMIVMVIAAFLVAGIYSLFITQHRSYSVQDQVAGIQQDARVALDIMARDIRMAGFMVGSGPFSINGASNAATPSDGLTTGTDSITIAYAAEEFMSTSGTYPVTVTNVASNLVTLSVCSGSLGTQLVCAATGVPSMGGSSDFFNTCTSGNKNCFVAFEGDAINAFYQISGITANTLTITPAPPVYLMNIMYTDSTGTTSTVGARVFRAKSIQYQVASNALQRSENGGTPQPLAGDGINTVVEDLQFAYQVQGDTANWWNTPAAAGATNDAITMVRITLVVRTAVPDAVVQGAASAAQFRQPPEENHTSSLAGPDGFRRRVYTTVVKVRNLK